MRSVAVFCGSKPGFDPVFLRQAKQLGELLAERGITLVYGGARSGLMGALADAVLQRGGQVIGVMPVQLESKEKVHPGLTQLIEVPDMQTRKEQMIQLSDGFIALPGGTGTLDEIFEVITLSQLGIHKKPCAFLDVAGFYDLLFQFMKSGTSQGFIHPDYNEMLIRSTDSSDLLNQMACFQHPHLTN